MSPDSQAISRLCLLGSITLVPNSLDNRSLRKVSLTDDILYQQLAFSLINIPHAIDMYSMIPGVQAL